MQSAKPTKKGASKMNNPMTYIQNGDYLIPDLKDVYKRQPPKHLPRARLPPKHLPRVKPAVNPPAEQKHLLSLCPRRSLSLIHI